ncbi:MAG: nucleoside triphosphate pyrophosphohydrolase [Actinomycetota bacterium]
MTPDPDARSRGEALLEVVRVMGRLRAPDGCPWDREQDHVSLRRQLLEETHEVLEAIDAADPDRLRDELGDLLIQVVFHSQIAEDEGAFTVDDVARGTVEKLVRRHPHVFGDVEAGTSEQVVRNWDAIKAEERGHAREDLDEDIPPTLPALLRAYKVQRRAAETGAEAAPAGRELDAIRDALVALEAGPVEEAIGDVLFAVVALARANDVDTESALRGAIRRFSERFPENRTSAT